MWINNCQGKGPVDWNSGSTGTRTPDLSARKPQRWPLRHWASQKIILERDYTSNYTSKLHPNIIVYNNVWNGLNAVVEKNLHLHWMASVNRYSMLHALNCTVNKKAQLSLTNPRDAKAYRCQQLLQFDVLTTLSLTIGLLAYSLSCCCVRNLRNPKKFTENSNLWSSRSSKVIDLGVNGKPICQVINCNFSRIYYRFRDIQA